MIESFAPAGENTTHEQNTTIHEQYSKRRTNIVNVTFIYTDVLLLCDNIFYFIKRHLFT